MMATHKGNEIGTDRKGLAALMILEQAKMQESYRNMTDAEVAVELMEMWAESSMLSKSSLLLDQAIDRLQRSGGGPLPPYTEDTDEDPPRSPE